MSQTIYDFPNGFSLRFALCYDVKGNKSTRFRRARIDNKHFEEAIASQNKNKLPLLDLSTSFDYPLIAADFDTLSDDFMDWDHFEQYLQQTYGNKGLVVRTPSGKCKILFQLHLPSTIKIAFLDREMTLKSLLLPEDFPLADKIPTALSKVYLTPDMLERFRTWKPIFHPPVVLEKPKPLVFSELEAKYTFEDLIDAGAKFSPEDKEVQKQVVSLLKCFNRMSDEKRNHIAIYLVRYGQHLSHGFYLNQKLMANMLNCTQANISQILTKMANLGWLIVGSSYSAGAQAKRVASAGELKVVLQVEGVNTKTIEELKETVIRSGQANAQYLSLNRQLARAGLSKSEIRDALIEIDKRRPINKQRKDPYFKRLVESYKK